MSLYGVVHYTEERDDGESVEWKVGARYFHPETPGNRRGHPDNWEPDEPGCVEVLEAHSADLGLMLDDREIDARFSEDTVEELRARVYEAAMNNDDCDGPRERDDDERCP